MKSVLISIQPKWCELIASGKKTVEVRKTKPKIETPFKVYIYCTQLTPYNPVLPMRYEKEGGNIYTGGKEYAEFLTGRVIGEFVCDEIFPIRVFENGSIQDYMCHSMERSCVPYDDISEYIGKDHTGYGWHISDLVIYDRPRALGGFRTLCEGLKPYQCDKCEYLYFENTESGSYAECCCDNVKPLKRPPQSWCYVEGDNNEHTD